MAKVQSHRSKWSYATRLAASFLLLSISIRTNSTSAKVIEMGSRFSSLVGDNPNANWLVMFYAPWCHYCRMFEPEYLTVADRVHNKLGNVYVGRVDCTENQPICEKHKIESFPSFGFFKKTIRVKYEGSKDVNELIEFAERLSGPDVGRIDDCKHLNTLISLKKQLVVSTMADTHDHRHTSFLTIASDPEIRAKWWFYHMPENKCWKDMRGVYILKKDLHRRLKFTVKDPDGIKNEEDIQDAMLSWLQREEFPVYGQLTIANIERALKTGKLLVVAVLEKFKPARRLTEPSRKFETSFETFAKQSAQIHDDIIFLTCTDMEALYKVALSQVIVPNVMLIKPDLTYSLLMDSQKDVQALEDGVPAKLHDRSLKLHIATAKLDELSFIGGDTLPYRGYKLFYEYYRFLIQAYYNQPFLAFLLLLGPTITAVGILVISQFNIVSDTDEGSQELDEVMNEELDDSEVQHTIDESRKNSNNQHINRKLGKDHSKQD